nr:hypothetical protein [Armatimonadota bacterium]
MEELDPGMFTVAKYRRVGFAVACVLLAVVALTLIIPFWHSIAWGVALAILVHPIHKRINSRYGDQISAAITTILTLLFIVLPLLLIGLAVFGEINHVRDQITQEAASGGEVLSVNKAIDDIDAS